MKQVLLVTSLGAAALAGGLGLILAADRLGWVPARGAEVAAAPAEMCRHRIDPARCPFCDPALVESMGMCGGHGVPEALCTRCNGALVAAFKVEGDWCAEHGLPESQCARCGAGAEGSTAGSPAPTEAPTGPAVMRVNRAPSPTCLNAFSTVQLKSPEIARRADFRIVETRAETIDETIACNAEVAFDGDLFAHLASRAAGSVAEVRAGLGDRVAAGDVLAVVDSADLGSAKATWLQARSLVDLWEKNAARERTLFERNVGTEKDVLEAETSLVESRIQLAGAEQRLKNLGLSAEDVQRVAAGDTSSLLPLRAPFGGVVVQRHAVTGEVISTAEPLFAVADLSRMWVMLDVYEADVARLRAGQAVTVSVDAMPDRTFDGELTWVSANVDPATRTIRARAEIDNGDGVLRANMFGRAEIHVRSIEDAVLVPDSAVQWDGCCNIVFVRMSDTVYQPYQVTLGYQRDGHYVVEKGLAAGEPVVTQGSFLLKTEILKGNIGAGCCEVDPGAAR